MAPAKSTVPTIESCQAAVALLLSAGEIPELVERYGKKYPDRDNAVSSAFMAWSTTRAKIEAAKKNEAEEAKRFAEESKHAIPLAAMEKRAEAAELALGQAIMKQNQMAEEMEELRRELKKRKAEDQPEEEQGTKGGRRSAVKKGRGPG